MKTERLYGAFIFILDYDGGSKTVFYSKDEQYVKDWCDRFNKIIDDNRERIHKWAFPEGEEERPGDAKECFWEQLVVWYKAKASVSYIELRTPEKKGVKP